VQGKRRLSLAASLSFLAEVAVIVDPQLFCLHYRNVSGETIKRYIEAQTGQ